MSIFNRLFKTINKEATNLFATFNSIVAPFMKAGEYAKAYKGWVYGCVNAIASEVANMEFILQRKNGDKWENVSSHPALDLLSKVNSSMTSSDLLMHTQSWIEIEGESFWFLIKNLKGSGYVEIWPLPPNRVKISMIDEITPAGYVFRNNKGEDIPFKVQDVIHFKTFNPKSLNRGMGTIEAAAIAIDTDDYASQWNRNFFYNSASPDVVLETEKSLTTEQYNRIKVAWESKYQGVANAHKFAILEGGLKANKTSMSQKDMDFLESRRFSMTEILAIFRVPKALLGIAEDFNRANIEGIQYMFARYVIKPKMQFICDRLNEFYLPKFGLKQSDFRFTFKDPVPQNVELDLKRKQTGLVSGYYSVNEVRAEEGLDPVPGGEVPFVSMASTPITDLAASSDPQPTKSVKKNIKLLSIVEKRVKFIRTEIKKSKQIYKDIFEQQKKQLLETLKNSQKDFKSIKKDGGKDLIKLLFANWDSWVGLLVDTNKEILSNSIDYAGKEAISQVDVNIDFDLENPRTQDWLSDNALKHATSIADTIKDALALRILEGVEQGSSIDDIANSISGFFDKGADWRALRIARTEVMAGYSEGSLEGYKQSGVVKGKKWLTAGDGKVEEECQMNEDQGVIGLNDTFASGDAAPPVHPNCRCVLQPEV
jgi:HK97 family phage portal protein